MRNIAADMLAEHMQRAFSENPRGELYRNLTTQDLMHKLHQNLHEVKLALDYGNDVTDKLADLGNYVAFIYRNVVDPVDSDSPEVQQLLATMHGMTFSWEQAEEVLRVVNSRTIGAVDVSEFGMQPYSKVIRGG